jgi:hypothetical protein
VSKIVDVEGRDHYLMIENGWREVCENVLESVKRFV